MTSRAEPLAKPSVHAGIRQEDVPAEPATPVAPATARLHAIQVLGWPVMAVRCLTDAQVSQVVRDNAKWEPKCNSTNADLLAQPSSPGNKPGLDADRSFAEARDANRVANHRREAFKNDDGTVVNVGVGDYVWVPTQVCMCIARVAKVTRAGWLGLAGPRLIVTDLPRWTAYGGDRDVVVLCEGSGESGRAMPVGRDAKMDAINLAAMKDRSPGGIPATYWARLTGFEARPMRDPRYDGTFC